MYNQSHLLFFCFSITPSKYRLIAFSWSLSLISFSLLMLNHKILNPLLDSFLVFFRGQAVLPLRRHLGVVQLALLGRDNIIKVVECRHQIEQFDEFLCFLLALTGNDLLLGRILVENLDQHFVIFVHRGQVGQVGASGACFGTVRSVLFQIDSFYDIKK